jgi:uncharacterized protein (TIGR02600 family)
MKLSSARRRGGFVLIVALGVLAVMTVLLLALLQGSSHQIRGAESGAIYAREKMLADSAVALVIGQIQQASAPAGQAWISQPGLIRTFGATASRQPLKCYKLYSSDSMIDASGGLAFLNGDVPADWDSAAKESFYVDLNAPAQPAVFLGAPIYPILDPAAIANESGAGGIEGVSVDSGHSIEMPVMWLYQLQDGTLGPAANGTKANPIVGRIAFWTDDETCKININAAGCGSPWNTPRANSTDDVAWSTTQPALGEFSRYPGHAAMTSLLPAFGLGGNPTPQVLLGLSPRYGWGGSEFGAKSTAPGEIVAAKTDRLYATLDEWFFGAGTSGNQRVPNPVTTAQLEQDRFVLTSQSVAPETSLLGEPRVAVWPVSDAPDDNTRTTAADRAIASAATVGAGAPVGPAGSGGRDYFFQRHDPSNSTDDFDSTTSAGLSNVRLFNELLARGSEAVPGYGTTFVQKYPGAKWTQLMLEITDFIHGLNAVDPSAAPFDPYAGGDPTTNLGRGFIVPLTTTDAATGTALRGLGRCPTLSGLTLVIYVCGFGLDDGTKKATTIDFDATPDDAKGTIWQANFDLADPANKWANVTSELLRAFVVPGTFHPGCAFPEVSDACDLEISGLNGLQVSQAGGVASGEFGFATKAVSPLLGNPLTSRAADRAWGGNDGPITWRAAGDALAGGGGATYPFAGTKAFKLPIAAPVYDAKSKRLTWTSLPLLQCGGVSGLTVVIRDAKANALQTFTIDLPAFTVSAPTIDEECDHRDGATPATSSATWSSDAATQVYPSYYMNLANRLLATQRSRPLMIQPGDVSRAVEAKTDLRVIAGLVNVPANMFQICAGYASLATPHCHNLRFADGTSAYGAYGTQQVPVAASCGLATTVAYPAAVATGITGTDWSTGKSKRLTSTWFTVPACSAPAGSRYVTMNPTQNIYGDWDTGPGFCPDGAMINLPDAGTSLDPTAAYFSLASGRVGAATRFAPNALVPSPVIFGSLPSGIDPVTPQNSEPWRTLLFCPNPASDFEAAPPATVTTTMHPGFASPPDHLLLDQFWMPTVEPYALSTVMATAGKINLNDQIAPFTYLHRNTAFHALLHDLRIPAIPATMGNPYKTAGTTIDSIWKPVDEDATISAMESRFANGDAYLAESEICTVPLVPQGSTFTGLDGLWNGANGSDRLTGDNLRELPYAQLYGRLCTRSNSYTVHLRVQVLKKLTEDPHQDVWNEGTDLVLGDWRGSYQIERYLDPAASSPAAGQPLGLYRFRVISARRFAP